MMRTEFSTVILAGGKSGRFNKQNKALIEFNRKPLVKHVIDCVRGFNPNIYLSVNRNLDKFAQFDLPLIKDDLTDFQGPLAGILKTMQECKDEFLLSLPCDTPFITIKLLERLTGLDTDAEIFVAFDGNKIQPAFALYKTSLLPDLENYIKSGERKLARWIVKRQHEKIQMEDLKTCFTNINDCADYGRHVVKTTYQDTPILGFVGFSGAGKTTLLAKLISKLKQRNIKVAVIKHTHHNFTIDKPGKDSFVFRESGAVETIIASDQRFALMVEDDKNIKLDDLLQRLDTDNIDLILLESYKREAVNKIEVWREDLQKPVLYPDDKSILGIATEAKPDKFSDKLVFDLNNIDKLLAFVLSYIDAT